MRALPDVRAADTFAHGRRVLGRATPRSPITGIDPDAVGRSIRHRGGRGRVPRRARGRARSPCSGRRWTTRTGSSATSSRSSARRDADASTIGAVIDSPAFGVPLVVSQAVLDALFPPDQQRVTTVFVTAADGADVAALRGELTATVRRTSWSSVMDSEEFVSDLADQVDQVLVILYALLGLSVVIAVLGIVNTLALSVIERTREIGLLRAVGLGRLQLGTTITLESVLTAVFGTVVGLVVGVALAATLPTVFADVGLRTLAIPWASLGAHARARRRRRGASPRCGRRSARRGCPCSTRSARSDEARTTCTMMTSADTLGG